MDLICQHLIPFHFLRYKEHKWMWYCYFAWLYKVVSTWLSQSNFELTEFFLLFFSDINECAMNMQLCQNGGTCLNSYGGYACVCVDGFTGTNCETSKLQHEAKWYKVKTELMRFRVQIWLVLLPVISSYLYLLEFRICYVISRCQSVFSFRDVLKTQCYNNQYSYGTG